MKKLLYIIIFVLFLGLSGFSQKVIRLYEGIAPGTKDTTVVENILHSQSGDITLISNVVNPSITIYLADPKIATGTAVVLCPGGAMHVLGWNNDVVKMAKFLNDRGIAAIGLKYRLQMGGMQSLMQNKDTKNPFGESVKGTVVDFEKLVNANANPSTDPESTESVYRAACDAQEAIRIIRNHAVEWNINPNKVGFLGFSAGGGVAIGAVVRCKDKESMPNFLAMAYGPSLIDVAVPTNAPPLFICTNVDHMNVAAGCLSLFLEWKRAGISAEMHMYDKGKGGFSLDKQGQTSDTWSESFLTWLATEGF